MPQMTFQQAFDLALQHHRAGRLHEAENLYRQILAHQPGHLDAMHLLGTIAFQRGRADLAVDLIRKAVADGLNTAHAHVNLGNALRGTGLLDEAIAAYRRAIVIDPRLVEAHYNLGSSLIDKKDFDGAIAALGQAIAIGPEVADPHTNLGNALMQKDRLDEAIAAHRRAIHLRPDYAEAYYNLGLALAEKGQLEDAITAYRKAIALRQGNVQAHCNLGVALKNFGQVDEAIAEFRRAIALGPGDVQSHSNLGTALKDQGQLDEALAALRQAVAIDPANAGVASNLIMLLQYHPGCDGRTIAAENRRWNDVHAASVRQFAHVRPSAADADRRLRIGYVSPDFRDHVVGRNILPLFRQHDHRQFEIICYSQTRRPDAVTAEFQQLADSWHNIAGLSDQQAADQIQRDRIDILVDLALHTADNRLLVFARKPAPVQVSFAGYPGSTGLTSIDHRLSDPWLDPPGMDESVCSENTIRLSDSFWCFDPLDCRDVPVNPLPALATGIVSFGCLNNFCKINDGVLGLWAKVLREVKNSKLLLRAAMGGHRARTLDRFRDKGIDPSRVDFVLPRPRREYLATYHRIDLGLDTFPYNGHTTSLECFWMGVPVVTIIGDRAVARAGWCQLSNLGLGELAGKTEEQFVQLAVELAKDLPRLGQLRATLRQRMEQSPLMDAAKFARNVEAAYRLMWHDWCENRRRTRSS